MFMEEIENLNDKNVQVSHIKMKQARSKLIEDNKIMKKKSIGPKGEGYFKFSQKLKPNFYELSEDQSIVTRSKNEYHGISLFAVIDNPFSKEHDQITFKIINQAKRFMYFGACEAETFRKNSFQGCYQLGGGMNAIRQDNPGKSAVCLHNSDKNFSNQHIVGWDFE